MSTLIGLIIAYGIIKVPHYSSTLIKIIRIVYFGG